MNPRLVSAGGAGFLAELTDGVALALPSHASTWADQILDYSRRRQIIDHAIKLQTEAADTTRDIGDIVSGNQKNIDRVLESTVIGAQSPEDLVFGYMEYLETLQRRGGSNLPTPFYNLNSHMGGLYAPEVTIIAARPSVGKTAMALNMAEYLARKKRGVGLFSLEMAAYGLMNRIYADRAGVDASVFRSGKFEDDHWKAIYAYTDKFQKLPMRIWDKPSLTPSQFRNQCRAWKREINMDVAFIDYLQLMGSDSRGASREREVAEASRAIKTCAMEFDIAIVLLSQLNREADKTSKPLLSQLRESGAVEQDADNILFIVPDKKTDPESPYCPCEINVAKAETAAWDRSTCCTTDRMCDF